MSEGNFDRKFEWDEAKRRANFAQHRVDFRDAVLIFDNPVLEAEDARTDYGEVRMRALGHFGDDFYVVIYTWRNDKRRIISAWKVGNEGRRRYQAVLGG